LFGVKKMKKLFVVVTVIFFSASISYSAEYWGKTYGGSSNESAFLIEQTDDDGDGEKDDGYIVTGTGEGGVLLIKVTNDGIISWKKTYGEFILDVGFYEQKGFSLRHTSDGGYILAGSTTSYGAGGADVLVLKLDSNGDITWQKTYGGAEDDYAFLVLEATDEGYLVVYGPHARYGSGICVLKLNSIGTVVWQKTYGRMDSALSLQQTLDGGYIIAGTTICPFGGHYNYSEVLKLDSAGNVSWMREPWGNSIPDVIQQTSDEGYIMVSEAVGSGGPLLLTKLDGTGNELWNKIFDQPPGEIGSLDSSVQQTIDGGYILASAWYNLGTSGLDYNIIVFKFDSVGNIAWQKVYGGSADDGARSICLTADGGYAVAGYTESYGSGGTDFFVLKLDSSGNILNCNISSVSNFSPSDLYDEGSDTSPSTGSTPVTTTETSIASLDISISIGDACECEADFNCDGNVDAIDVTSFLTDFGRNQFNNPCTSGSPCNGDFNCDGNVDSTDVTKFLEDFGRNQFFNPCPACVAGDWCVY
jgi:ABC-type cobalt transport system substrate-binding protein